MTPPDESRLEAESRFVQREVVLLIVLALAALGAFQLTRTVASREQRATIRDAAAWYDTGVRQLQDGRVDDAVIALRHATSRDRENRTYVTALARALVAAGRRDDAKVALLELRDSAPEDPLTNVELARLAAERRDVTEAARYYRNALYGVWNGERAADRASLHIEFIRFLLASRQPSIALAELLALVPNLPDDAAAHLQAGQLLLAAGDAGRARAQCERALAIKPRNREALGCAGEAAFVTGDYAAVGHLLGAMTAPSPRLADLRELSALILASDPLAPRLATVERWRRLVAAVAQAADHLDECRATATSPSVDAGARLETLRSEADAFEPVLAKGHRASPDEIEAGAALVYRIEQAVADACGAPVGLDQALLINGRRHGAQTP